MSLCMTCKELEIDPQAYLRDVLDRISTHPARRIEELLPDRWRGNAPVWRCRRGLTVPEPRACLLPDSPGAMARAPARTHLRAVRTRRGRVGRGW